MRPGPIKYAVVAHLPLATASRPGPDLRWHRAICSTVAARHPCVSTPHLCFTLHHLCGCGVRDASRHLHLVVDWDAQKAVWDGLFSAGALGVSPDDRESTLTCVLEGTHARITLDQHVRIASPDHGAIL